MVTKDVHLERAGLCDVFVDTLLVNAHTVGECSLIKWALLDILASAIYWLAIWYLLYSNCNFSNSHMLTVCWWNQLWMLPGPLCQWLHCLMNGESNLVHFFVHCGHAVWLCFVQVFLKSSSISPESCWVWGNNCKIQSWICQDGCSYWQIASARFVGA